MGTSVATAAEVVAAIDHVLRYKPNWRGSLNDSDFAVLNDMYERAKNHPEAWLGDHDLPTSIDDKYLGALRLDNPTLFDRGRLVDPPGAHPSPASTRQGPVPLDDEGFSGRAAQASQRVENALAKNKTALAEADEELVDALLGAKTGSQESKGRLRALQGSLIDEITKLGPSLDTPAGQEQLNDYLQGKVQEIRGIVKSSAMDAQSKAEVLDALVHRYEAVKDSGTGAGPASPDVSARGSAQPGGPAQPAAVPAPLANDPLLDGLASDPLMAGLGAVAGPAMGALGGLPGALGSIIPGAGGFGGGGGLPLGDLGGAIGGAIHDATARNPRDATSEIAEPSNDENAEHDHDNKQPEEGAKPASDKGTVAAQPGNGEQPQPVAAGSGQVEPPAQAQPDVSVKLPDGETVTADSPQLAHAGRLHLEGASLEDAAGQAQVNLLPAGAPVTEPVSPKQLHFGDYAQFTDHRVMALSPSKVWLGGQVTNIDQMPTGPNFLGWARPQVQTTPAATVLAGAK